jgi:hypothetical protein
VVLLVWLAGCRSRRVLVLHPHLLLLLPVPHIIIILVSVYHHHTTIVVSVVPVTVASPDAIKRLIGLPLSLLLRCAVITVAEPQALLRGTAAACVARTRCLARTEPRGGLYEVDFRGGSGGTAALAH